MTTNAEKLLEIVVPMLVNSEGLPEAGFNVINTIAEDGNIVIGDNNIEGAAKNELVAPAEYRVVQLNGHNEEGLPIVQECETDQSPYAVIIDVESEEDVTIRNFGLTEALVKGNVSIGDELTISDVAGCFTAATGETPENMKLGIAVVSHVGGGLDIQNVFLNAYT